MATGNTGKYNEHSDTELFDKIKNYDSRAVEELFNRYGGLVYTLVKEIVKDAEAAEKIVTDVFAIIWKKSDMYNSKSNNPYVWIITLARNKATDHMRRNVYTDTNPGEYTDEYENTYIIPTLDPGIDKLNLSSAKGMSESVKEAFSGLTEAQKYVITLSYYNGYNIDQISKKLNIPVETVRNKVMTAMSHLRDNLLKV